MERAQEGMDDERTKGPGGDREHERRTEEPSPDALRSTQTHTQPEWMYRRSSMSSRRETMGNSPSETAWKMTCASAMERMRMPVQVGSCICILDSSV